MPVPEGNPADANQDRASLPPIRVMVVDDSAVIRGYVARALEAAPDMVVAASAANGEAALLSLRNRPVDVVILDIEMPVMDGMTALPKILALQPGVRVIVASTLTRRSAEISLRALAAGASETLAKPEAGGVRNAADAFHRRLVETVRALGRSPAPGAPSGRSSALPSAPRVAAPAVLRSRAAERPSVLAIASSTGGPQALCALLADLGPGCAWPILVTQHMPPTFTTILAEHLARASGLPAAEAVDGEPLGAPRIHVAPGNWHMRVATGASGPVIRLDQEAPENFCRPSADPMLRSLAAVCRHRVLAVVLTGMGRDGLEGARAVVAGGGTVLAQDAASSVVWGMPGAVATAGLCSAVLPLQRLGAEIRRRFDGCAGRCGPGQGA